MQDSEYVKHSIWEWSEAKAAAKENTTLMTESGFSESVMNECAKRMERLGYAETGLMEIQANIPQPLQNFIDARQDKGCMSCWLSSAGPKHPDCRKKIDRFFQTEKDLFCYARNFCSPK
jgi:hypothetical protein